MKCSKIILTLLLVNIYVDDSMVYRSTTKNLDDQNLTADLSSDLARIAQWRRNWLVAFNNSKTKLETFHHHRVAPYFPLFIMNSGILLGLKQTPDLKQSWYIYDPKLKMLEKWSSLCTTTEIS